MDKISKKADQPEGQEEDQKNVLEWVVFSFSLTLILALFGYLIYQTIHYEPGSPDLVVTYKPDPSSHAPYRYHLTIHNQGQETAQEVQVELVLEKGGKQLELATINLPFAPKESRREGWVNFSNNPEAADSVYSRVVSYKKP
jgi:uncharacterized protein (TIGR02588 family)